MSALDRDAVRAVCFDHMIAPTADLLDALDLCVQPDLPSDRENEAYVAGVLSDVKVENDFERRQRAWRLVLSWERSGYPSGPAELVTALDRFAAGDDAGWAK